MRLIDADKLKPSLIAELVCDDGNDEEDIIAYKIETIENAPTVEAIPIEWLKENYGNLQIVRYIMKDWEIEKCTIQKK